MSVNSPNILNLNMPNRFVSQNFVTSNAVQKRDSEHSAISEKAKKRAEVINKVAIGVGLTYLVTVVAMNFKEFKNIENKSQKFKEYLKNKSISDWAMVAAPLSLGGACLLNLDDKGLDKTGVEVSKKNNSLKENVAAGLGVVLVSSFVIMGLSLLKGVFLATKEAHQASKEFLAKKKLPKALAIIPAIAMCIAGLSIFYIPKDLIEVRKKKYANNSQQESNV